MLIGDWISIFMALIALMSAAITYLVYRAATDPEVIVYATPDPRRPTVFNLIIKNIGKGPAIDIKFKTSKVLPDQAWSIKIPDEIPKPMTDGPLVTGVSYLAPDQELIITWGQYGGIKRSLGDSAIEVKSICKRRRIFRPSTPSVVYISKLDITQFETSDAGDYNWGAKLVKSVDNLNNEVSKISRFTDLVANREQN